MTLCRSACPITGHAAPCRSLVKLSTLSVPRVSRHDNQLPDSGFAPHAEDSRLRQTKACLIVHGYDSQNLVKLSCNSQKFTSGQHLPQRISTNSFSISFFLLSVIGGYSQPHSKIYFKVRGLWLAAQGHHERINAWLCAAQL